MLSIERRNEILGILRAEKSVLVGSLSRKYGVSEETIRRDLEKLEREGLAMRTYGGAVLCENDKLELPYTVRKRTNVEAKQAIAASVCELVRDGDFLMLDESSTSAFVARAIRGKKRITVITNSIEIIMELSGVRGWNIQCTGGVLKEDVLALTGNLAESMVRSYHVDTAIISCTAIDLRRGFTDAGDDNARIKRAMMASAERTILAADSRKFGRTAFAQIGSLADIATLATDADPGEEWRGALAECGVTLVLPTR